MSFFARASRLTLLSAPGQAIYSQLPTSRAFTHSAIRRTTQTPSQPFGALPPIYQELLHAKKRKGLSYEAIGKAIGKDEVWTAAAFMGQARFEKAELDKLAALLELPASADIQSIGEAWWPQRGLGPMPPSDPVIYRLYEGVMVYGQPIKAVIHEKFGDGIMSLIDCRVTVDKKPDPKGDRVLLTFDGKFLPYLKW
ncbi:Cyanase [Punctularia strigosozonata HHB-11173 SS5]|uniref:Cyanase n=1 Tax=Punctularia strigosozonata (strain HHB-11173) TaxID=741275 RepID=UPI0004416566|nr:Cyanase [Punctularia strigosozonata HHB-11173 SS5]EIN08157.1 Cyanase [Punctularia strigosozonata HHB-11173 SS5]